MKLKSRRKFLKDTVDVAKAVATAAPAASLVSTLLSPNDANAQRLLMEQRRSKRKSYVGGWVGGKFRTSTEGINWTTVSNLPLITSNDVYWTDIAWNGTVYCIVGNGGALATSTNGSTWTVRTSPFTEGGSRIIWNGSKFLALSAGSTNLAATSADGITWTQRTLPTTADWTDVVWNGTIFCAIAQTGTIAATSTDGITWTQRTLATSSYWYSLAWNGTVFCAVGVSSATDTSPDGITWTAQTPPGTQPVNITVSGTTFYVSDFGTSKIFSSTDNGVSWSQVGVAAPFPAVGFAMNGANFAIIYGGTCWYSTDTCATWNTGGSTSTSNSGFKSLRYLNGKFWKPSNQGGGATWKGLAYSATGATWTGVTMPSASIVPSFSGIAASSSRYVLVPYTDSDVSVTSTDGINWTTGTLPHAGSWSSCATDGTIFCAMPFTSSNIAASSTDGSTWTARTLPASAQWVDVIWNGSIFCAISGWNASTTAATSPDGQTWTARSLPNGQWRRVAWNGSLFVVVGGGTNQCATSPDGITWTARTMPVNTTWGGVCWTGKKFVAVAGYDVALSSDGITWTSGTNCTAYAYHVTWNGENLIAVGNGLALSPNQGVTWANATQTPSGVGSGNVSLGWVYAK